ncbi:hypothetical protein GWK47_025882 [Chionoecetes opilio]|uniref:Uncharacterized protein n=1 Tax=Chionoecetes opilio TaxID=41210 RepID=A0A8J8WN04_CHIOP|nr:hypothetical protein GWK47_025882 [Chionoecetes opilio]
MRPDGIQPTGTDASVGETGSEGNSTSLDHPAPWGPVMTGVPECRGKPEANQGLLTARGTFDQSEESLFSFATRKPSKLNSEPSPSREQSETVLEQTSSPKGRLFPSRNTAAEGCVKTLTPPPQPPPKPLLPATSAHSISKPDRQQLLEGTRDTTPTPENPVPYHLHGRVDERSQNPDADVALLCTGVLEALEGGGRGRYVTALVSES